MQPVQFTPQLQQQTPQIQPVQFRPQLPQLQQRAVQPAAEEQPPAPAIPQPSPQLQPEQPANHPAENINQHHIAPMNNTCPHCGAKYFREELTTRKQYTSTKDGAAPDPNDRILHTQRPDSYLIDLKATNPTVEPLTYPLLFGEQGWCTTIARLPPIRTVNRPDQAQRHQTELILLPRKGATSFKDIRTVDGVTHNTFKNAARAMSLLEDDADHRRSLRDAVMIDMPAQMRQLFATLILFQTLSNIHASFTEFQENTAEDYARHDQLQDANATF
eukprot:gene13162-biopygen10496